MSRLTLIVLTSVVFVFASACVSHTRQIDDGASYVQYEAAAGISDLSTIEPTPDNTHKVSSAVRHFENIQAKAAAIRESARHVKDIVPLWRRLLSLWWVPVLGLIAAFALIQWFPMVFGKMVAWIVVKIPQAIFLIPGHIREAAKVDAKAVNPDDSMQQEEAIAAKRAKDPRYDAAFRAFNRS